MTDCLVSLKDYMVYWFDEAGVQVYPPVPVWNGTERRVGAADRRAVAHDRRWEKARGRRFRLRGRRLGDVR